ncbi:MAG: DUF167 domain-containing protein [Pirellulales bacterium]
MIDFQLHAEGVILPVRARAGARRNEVRGAQNGRLKVSVTQSAEKGKANRVILKLLSDALNVRRSQLELISGETVAEKRILIRETTAMQIRAAVERLI